MHCLDETLIVAPSLWAAGAPAFALSSLEGVHPYSHGGVMLAGLREMDDLPRGPPAPARLRSLPRSFEQVGLNSMAVETDVTMRTYTAMRAYACTGRSCLSLAVLWCFTWASKLTIDRPREQRKAATPVRPNALSPLFSSVPSPVIISPPASTSPSPSRFTSVIKSQSQSRASSSRKRTRPPHPQPSLATCPFLLPFAPTDSTPPFPTIPSFGHPKLTSITSYSHSFTSYSHLNSC